MPFSPEVKTEAFLACGRCCCLCHSFCAVRIEAAHIIAESKGGTNDFENCIPLCFNCHAEVEHYNPQHPKGNKFTSEELRRHRDSWYERCSSSNFPNPQYPSVAPDPSLTVITKDDVVRAFAAIPDFSQDDVRRTVDYLHNTLLRNGVVTLKQLYELVSSGPILGWLRRIYIDLLLRPREKPLDPAAIAVWGAHLYSHQMSADVMRAIEMQLHNCQEYRDKH